MNTDIDNLNIDQLRELTEKAQVLIEKKKSAEIDDAFRQLLDVAASVNMTLDELIAHGQKTKRVVKRSVAPRYRNPNNLEQTWTGRGKKPRWVQDLLDQGKQLDELMI